MPIRTAIVLALFVVSFPLHAEEDLKETVSSHFEKASKELTEQENKLIAASPKDTREALRKSLAQWREWAKSYAAAKYSGQRGAGSIGFYYRLDMETELYQKQIEWLRHEIGQEPKAEKEKAVK